MIDSEMGKREGSFRVRRRGERWVFIDHFW